ncbi:MAG TPA: hypothetical protein DCE55_26030 [Planctomycetaceae bacterium]|nr:hypothetical protein [Planctomycetaceae bacterium]
MVGKAVARICQRLIVSLNTTDNSIFTCPSRTRIKWKIPRCVFANGSSEKVGGDTNLHLHNADDTKNEQKTE